MGIFHIGKVIKKSFGKSAVGRQIELARALNEFNKLIGEIWGTEMLERAKGAYIKDNILTVACLSSAAAQEIKLREKEILEKINKDFGEEALVAIRFQF